MSRAERVVLLGLGLCFGPIEPAIYLVAALSAISVAQRVHHSLRELAGKP